MLQVTIRLTEKQLKLLEPLRVLTIDGMDKNKNGMVLAQIALDDFSHPIRGRQQHAMRGECMVAFIPNEKAIKLQKAMSAETPEQPIFNALSTRCDFFTGQYEKDDEEKLSPVLVHCTHYKNEKDCEGNCNLKDCPLIKRYKSTGS